MFASFNLFCKNANFTPRSNWTWKRSPWNRSIFSSLIHWRSVPCDVMLGLEHESIWLRQMRSSTTPHNWRVFVPRVQHRTNALISYRNHSRVNVWTAKAKTIGMRWRVFVVFGQRRESSDSIKTLLVMSICLLEHPIDSSLPFRRFTMLLGTTQDLSFVHGTSFSSSCWRG